MRLASLVQPWNEQLIGLATQIHRARNRYVDLLNEALDHNLFHDDISIRYVSSLEGKGDLDRLQELSSPLVCKSGCRRNSLPAPV